MFFSYTFALIALLQCPFSNGFAEYTNWPAMEFCHNTAKMFIELEQDKSAVDIWESLLEVDDNIAEIHYHLGLAYRFISTSASKECLTKAKQVCF